MLFLAACTRAALLLLPQGVAHVLAAMVPCARLYGWLGVQLAAAHGTERGAYSDWVVSYSGAAYLALPALKEDLLERLAGGSPDAFGARAVAALVGVPPPGAQGSPWE